MIERKFFDWLLIIFLVVIQITQISWLRAFYLHEMNSRVDTVTFSNLAGELSDIRKVEENKIQTWRAFHEQIRDVLVDLNINAEEIKILAEELKAKEAQYGNKTNIQK